MSAGSSGVSKGIVCVCSLLSTPEIAWETSLGIYLAWGGFRSTRIVGPDSRAPAVEPSMAAV
jgi:hypothetical protein